MIVFYSQVFNSSHKNKKCMNCTKRYLGCHDHCSDYTPPKSKMDNPAYKAKLDIFEYEKEKNRRMRKRYR